jgi:hypothetical protein
VHDLVAAVWVERRLAFLDDRNHLLPEESVSRHELDLSRWFDLHLLLLLEIALALVVRLLWILKTLPIFIIRKVLIENVLVFGHEWKFYLMDFLFDRVDGSVVFLNLPMALVVALFGLKFKSITFFLGQLVEPFGLD